MWLDATPLLHVNVKVPLLVERGRAARKEGKALHLLPVSFCLVVVVGELPRFWFMR